MGRMLHIVWSKISLIIDHCFVSQQLVCKSPCSLYDTQETGDLQWDFYGGQRYSHIHGEWEMEQGRTGRRTSVKGCICHRPSGSWVFIFLFCHVISSYLMVPSHNPCIQGTKVLQQALTTSNSVMTEGSRHSPTQQIAQQNDWTLNEFELTVLYKLQEWKASCSKGHLCIIIFNNSLFKYRNTVQSLLDAYKQHSCTF